MPRSVTGGKIINSANYGSVSGTGNVGATAGRVANARIECAYYAYNSADNNGSVGSRDAASSIDTLRFSSSPTVCLTEKEKTVGSVTSDDLVELLNAWTSADGGAKWRKWVLNTTAEGIERTAESTPIPLRLTPAIRQKRLFIKTVSPWKHSMSRSRMRSPAYATA